MTPSELKANILILALPNGGTLRLAPGGKIIGTDKKNGQIKVIR